LSLAERGVDPVGVTCFGGYSHLYAV
jgi:hypothetical protein